MEAQSAQSSTSTYDRTKATPPPVLDVGLWKRQGQALETPATEVLYGGAAGGGKSYLMRVASIIWCLDIPGLQVYLFRRVYEDLLKNHVAGPKGYRSLLAPLVSEGWAQVLDDQIRFFNGSQIYLCHCQHLGDETRYQGSEIHVLLIDELTHFLEPMYRFLRQRVRMIGIRLPTDDDGSVRYEGQFPRILCGSNPGSVGHLWVKNTWITGKQEMMTYRQPMIEGGMLRQFIPARLDDNPSMMQDDPGYESRLEGLGSKTLVAAMRWGDWDVVEGAFFDCWSHQRHVLPPHSFPRSWLRFRSMDWGSASPFSVGWWYVVQDDCYLEDDGVRAWLTDASGRPLALDPPKLGTGDEPWTGGADDPWLPGRPRGLAPWGKRDIPPGQTDGMALDAALSEAGIQRGEDEHTSAEPGQGNGGEAPALHDRGISGQRSLEGRKRRLLPRGAIVRYREDYGDQIGVDAKGLKLDADDVAKRIVKLELDDPKLGYGVLDPRCFAVDGGPSIAERMNTVLLRFRMAPFRKADNRRVNLRMSRDAGGPLSGWDAMRARLIGKKVRKTGDTALHETVPMIFCFSTCFDSIRTIPVMQHDKSRAEDMDTHGEDHAADEWRYACMSRPWLRSDPEPLVPKDGYTDPHEEIVSDRFMTL